jgi:hypothetical protein
LHGTAKSSVLKPEKSRMKEKIFSVRKCAFRILLVFLLLGSRDGLFAFGRKQAVEEKEPINTGWTLCITAIDVSAMSPSWQTAGDTVARSLTAALQNLDFRFRGNEESAYYMNYALSKSRSKAADALIKKRNERDLLLFKGDPSWKYEKDLKAADEAIIKLEEDLAKIEELASPIDAKPALTISQKNIDGVFPEVPKQGLEYRFCADEKIDAFLTGDMIEYYGRIYLTIKMYTLFTNSYSFEDSILFSPEDFNGALAEISTSLAAAVSEIHPSAIIVHAVPPEAMVLVNGSYVGQGDIDMLIRSPGEAEIAVYADNYTPVEASYLLNSGELTELFINLTSLGRDAFFTDTPGSPGSRVFLGSLYVGETPLTLELPRSQYAYISVETGEGEIGSVIVRDNAPVRNRTLFRRKEAMEGTADFMTAFPVSEEEKQVGNARNKFYRYYGAFWLILPATLLAGGIAKTHIAANDYVIANNLYAGDPERRQQIASKAAMGRVVRTGAYGIMGVSLGLTFFQIFKYLNVSGGDSTPLIKVKPKSEGEDSGP